MTVKALLSAAPAAGAPSDEITAVSSGTDVVTFAFPVSDGDVVRYLVGNGFTQIGGGLTADREYNVLVDVQNASIRLGSRFDPFTAVDPLRDIITFDSPHNFVNGDRVIYTPGAGLSVIAAGQSVVAGQVLFVRLIKIDDVNGVPVYDAFRLRLTASATQAAQTDDQLLATNLPPRNAWSCKYVISICLLASSPTISAAVRALEHGRMAAFKLWWLATIVLGRYLLTGPAREWYMLIYEHGLTIRTNLFGTTYYSLVGLHASHLIFGLVALTLTMAFSWLGYVRRRHARAHPSARHVLAFRRLGVGHRAHGGLHHRPLRRRRPRHRSAHRAQNPGASVVLPAPPRIRWR